MTEIWKFPLRVDDSVEITMPEGAEILTIMVQNNQPCIWARVNTTADPEVRTFHVVGTGHEISDRYELRYVGSFQLVGGAFVGHVFEEA